MSRDALATATKDCIDALIDASIDIIHFVYDYNMKLGKTSWQSDQLQRLAKSKCGNSELAKITVSDAQIVADRDSNLVQHPLFGSVPRGGWAQMNFVL